ncbi:GGDEF-domain containing protein [Colwellia sp. 75C3]|uniref:putative bifunctional diguanylate cyclase/phosphodiesterase n=1 Tax=Colwellia sp. 75C3 TaxID=888425 RepID=UPI000C327C78|nr:EAL domain-containing protein [Colwellia sp. 75C3]PKG83877.1 GGDEF-domain containing protein [Colwellia sp. 75C3]
MKFSFNIIKKNAITLLFLCISLIVLAAFLELEHSGTARVLTVLFITCLSVSYFIPDKKLKNYIAIFSVALIVFIGLYFPLDIEEIEELYIFIPILYLFIFPGSLWPIAIALLLTTAYMPSLATTELSDFIEDTLELIFISSFATIMVFFQQKSLKEMQYFRHESYTDYLTRLPNRKMFLKQLAIQEKLTNASDDNANFSLLIVDLDGFKKINDQLGHLAGDNILRMVATRLELLITDNIKTYRLGGDEFAFIVNSTTELENLKKVTQQLSQQILQQSNIPYKLEHRSYSITSSVGISNYPADADNLETLCTNADVAMYKAKSNGKNTSFFYEMSLLENTLRRYELEHDLKSAIANNEMYLLFQPKVDLASGDVLSAEALLRWQHPKHGFVSPAEFIPIAEESNSIIEIGDWVIRTTCENIVQWKKEYNFTRIAVNVSAVQLAQTNFIKRLRLTLEETQCQPDWLEVEQTESWIMNNPEENIRVLDKLKKLGVYLSLDDFGTAYSSLSQIGRLPLDVLKIDKSFIDNCVKKTQDHMIVRTIIQLGHNLNMKVIAEGVEDEEQRDLLISEGCDEYQGYLFSKPVPAEQFVETLNKK